MIMIVKERSLHSVANYSRAEWMLFYFSDICGYWVVVRKLHPFIFGNPTICDWNILHDINLERPHDRTKALLHSYCRTVWELFASEVQRSESWSGMFMLYANFRVYPNLLRDMPLMNTMIQDQNISIIVINL